MKPNQFALVAGCAGLAAIHGLLIPPEGDLTKAISFAAAVGVYLLTLGVFVPLAQFSAAGERRWLAVTIGSALYAFGIETVQTLRGLDPRFSRAGAPADQLASLVFSLVALGLIATFSMLAVKLVRRGTGGTEGLLLLAFRYASIATMLAFAAGVWMIAVHGRKTGVAGNILPLHALGFHALQAIPLVAWLFSLSASPPQEARGSVHAAGAAWIAAYLAVAWQTLAGRPVTEPSPAILAACVGLLGWGLSAVRAFSAWRTSVGPAVPHSAG